MIDWKFWLPLIPAAWALYCACRLILAILDIEPGQFLQRLLGRSDIYGNGRLYMRRWLFPPAVTGGVGAWLKLLPGIRVHNIVRSDADRELHDHPFDFVSLILWGGYFEITESPLGGFQRRWHGPGSVVFRRAEKLHRIELAPHVTKPWAITVDPETRSKLPWLRERPAWTLVLRGPIRRDWGFMTPRGWLHWREFVADKGQPQEAPRPAFAAKSST